MLMNYVLIGGGAVLIVVGGMLFGFGISGLPPLP